MKRITAYILVLCLILVCLGCNNERDRINIPDNREATVEKGEKDTTIEENAAEENAAEENAAEENAAEENAAEENTTEENTAEENITEESTAEENTQTQTLENVTNNKITANDETTVNASGSSESSGSNDNKTGAAPVDMHGSLHVEGTDLVDEYGEKMQLYGMSTHGLSWFPQYVSYETFKTLRDDWNTNCIRLAMYTAEYNGYCTGGNKEELKQIINNGVSYATDLGMYVIIDWHVLNDNDPNVYKTDAIEFFNEMSAKYSGSKNVIYEICNEPNGYASWDSIKSYANEIIPVIRANAPDAVIIVGTPTWSQDIDKALESPLSFDNIMYALHFYAATHTDWLRSRVTQCIDGGLPVFISEFGICDSSGNGGIDYNQSEEWMSLIKKYNLSYCCWNLSNKAETSSVIGSWCNTVSWWSENDLSEAGRWIRNQFKSEN